MSSSAGRKNMSRFLDQLTLHCPSGLETALHPHEEADDEHDGEQQPGEVERQLDDGCMNCNRQPRTNRSSSVSESPRSPRWRMTTHRRGARYLSGDVVDFDRLNGAITNFVDEFRIRDCWAAGAIQHARQDDGARRDRSQLREASAAIETVFWLWRSDENWSEFRRFRQRFSCCGRVDRPVDQGEGEVAEKVVHSPRIEAPPFCTSCPTVVTCFAFIKNGLF